MTVVARRSRAAALALLAALVVAELAVLLLSPPAGLSVAPVRADGAFSPAQLDRARAFGHGQLALGLAALAAQALALAALVVVGRRKLRGPWRRPVLAAGVTGAACAVAVSAAALPFSAWSHRRAVDVGLATGSWGIWAWDAARGLLLVAVLAAPATAAAIALMRRLPRGWWVPAAGLVVLAGLLVELVWPVLVAPRFNRFDPLPAGPVRSELLRLADRAGVRVGEVSVVDASRRTRAVNAYVTGVGSSRRIVLYDTLLGGLPERQVRVVVAHELGHVRHRDVPRGLLFLLLVAPAAVLAVATLARAWGPVHGARAGPREVPALLAATALVALLVLLVSNQLSRAVEARADAFALRLTGDPAAFVAQERAVALRNVLDPDPPGLAHALFGTHPTTLERIGMARAFAASRGQADAGPGSPDGVPDSASRRTR